MKYFVGYLIQGEAAKWHVDLAKEISQKFNTWKIHENIPPHITIVYPFDTEKIMTIKDLLREWAASQPIVGNFALSDFDHFDEHVVFAKVDADQSVKESVVDLRSQLKAMPDMPVEDYPDWHPHVTLANKLTPEEIVNIWNYVSVLQKPNFILPFDNVTLFYSTGDTGWRVDK